MLLVIIVFFTSFITRPQSVPNEPKQLRPPRATNSTNLVSYFQDRINQQSEIENELLSEFNNNNYTLDSPLIIQNPYKNTPLTAIIAFRTTTPSHIKIHLAGKDELTQISFDFKLFQIIHWIPVYGLYPDTNNHLTITATDKNGFKRTQTYDIQTEPLQDSMPKIEIKSADTQLYQPGFNFTNRNNKIVFDFHGDIRWYFTMTKHIGSGVYRLKNGNMLVFFGEYFNGPVVILELDLLGRIYSAYFEPYGAHHDIIEDDNGNIFLTGSGFNLYNQDVIVKMDSHTGRITRAIDLKEILDVNRPSMSGTQNYRKERGDWLHMNAILSIPAENALLLSGRNQSSVAKIEEKNNSIKWIMGPHDLWPEEYKPFLLTPIGKPFEWSYAQHSIQILPDTDRNPDTLDLLLFDNGRQRSYTADPKNNVGNRYSRLVIYRINQAKMTVEQLWDWGKQKGISLYTSYVGDANLLQNGNILGSFYIKDDKNFDEIVEVTPDGKIAFSAQLYWENTFVTYRTERLVFYMPDSGYLKIGNKVRNYLYENH